MPLTVLSDAQVRELLHSLDPADVRELQASLANTLHDYSTGTQESTSACSANQPMRISVGSAQGGTTLFMPAATPKVIGIKMVTLAAVNKDGAAAEEVEAEPARKSRSGSGGGSARRERERGREEELPGGGDLGFESAGAGSAHVRRPSAATQDSGAGSGSSRSGSFRSSLSGLASLTGLGRSGSGTRAPGGTRSGASTPRRSGSGTRTPSHGNSNSTSVTSIPSLTSAISSASISSPESASTASAPPPISPKQKKVKLSTTPRGAITILEPDGSPLGLIAAEELTAFRTALAATMIFRRRARVHTIAVFGAGSQARWHIRLALLLRGHDIHHVHVINRTFAGASPLMQEIYTSPEWTSLREKHCSSKLTFSLLSAEFGEYNRLLKEHVREADAIFCCTPSTTALFPAEHLTSREGARKGRYLSLIGSYRPHMREVDPEILRHAVAPDHGRHHHKHADRGGVVVVDGLEACLREAGEIIQAGLTPDQLVEIGEVIMVRRAAEREIEMGGEGEQGMKRWLVAGNVIYKSVGMGIMDMDVAAGLVALARQRGVGTTIEDF